MLNIHDVFQEGGFNMIVLIDDERDFMEKVDAIILRNSNEALRWLKNIHYDTIIDQLWLDHDLGIVNGRKDTIIPVIHYLEEQCFYHQGPNILHVLVHTSNNVGGKEMIIPLSKYYHTTRVFAGDYLTVK